MKNTMPNQSERSGTLSGGVVLSPNLKKTKEMINANGDVIDPVTKQIIRKSNG